MQVARLAPTAGIEKVCGLYREEGHILDADVRNVVVEDRGGPV